MAESVTSNHASSTSKSSRIASVIIGIVFLTPTLLSLGLGLLTSCLSAVQTVTVSQYPGPMYISAYSAVQYVVGQVCPPFFVAASAFSCVTGIMILQKRTCARQAAILAVVLHLLCVGLCLLMPLLLLIAPEVLLSTVSPDHDVLSTAKEMLRNDGMQFAPIWLSFLGHLLISAVLTAAGSIFAILVKPTKTVAKTDRSALLLSVCAVVLGVFTTFPNTLTRMFIGFAMGKTAMQGYSAFGYVSAWMSCVWMMAIMVLLAVAVLTHKCRFRITSMTIVPALVIGNLALYLVLWLISPSLYAVFNISEESIALAKTFQISSSIASTLMLPALAVWFLASAKRAIPLLIQALLLIALPFAYGVGEYVRFVALSAPALPIGAAACAVLLIAVSLVCAAVRSKQDTKTA